MIKGVQLVRTENEATSPIKWKEMDLCPVSVFMNVKNWAIGSKDSTATSQC